MEWKYASIFAVALLLALPFAFADGSGNDGTDMVPASASVAATAPSTCPVPTHEVCQGGTVEYKAVDEHGCVQYKCRPVPNPTPNSNEVSISLISDSQVSVGSQIKAVGTITYNGDPNVDNIASKKFKVVLNYQGGASSLVAHNGGIRFADATAPSRGDAISNAIQSIVSAFTPRSADNSEPQAEAGSADTGSSGGSGGSVAAVSVDASSLPQEQTDYVTLKPSETTSVTAYFTARSAGNKLVRMRVYEYTGTTCPDGTPAVGAPCREDYRQVAETSAKVKVTGETPPPPPSVNGTVASGVIYLYSGWNMVSVPVGQKVDMGKVSGQCSTPQYAWRLTQNGYVKESTLVPGYGYWIKAAQDCRFEVSGSSYTSGLADLFPGWNLVGAPGNEEAFSGYTGSCQVTAGPWYYNNGPSATAASPYSLSSTLSPGKAYWVKVGSACHLGSTEEQPPVPPS